MKFGWINALGAGFIVLMMIPNIVYAIKNKGEKSLCTNTLMNVTEQIGRYGCIILMWLPFPVPEFGFRSIPEMLLYAAGNGALLAFYWFVFARYLKKKTKRRALILAIAPACVFLLSGLLLRHWALAGFAVLFAVGHIYVTWKNTESKERQRSQDA